MTQEENKIREGLIALICVGDRIKHVGMGVISSYITDVIREDTVIQILDDNMLRMRTRGGVIYLQSLYFIDEYNGELYIFNDTGVHHNIDYDERIDMLTSIINSDQTEFINHDKRI
jgi:hypothetical protein